jgi:hypothetical protein
MALAGTAATGEDGAHGRIRPAHRPPKPTWVATPRPISRAWKPKLHRGVISLEPVATPRPISRAWKRPAKGGHDHGVPSQRPARYRGHGNRLRDVSSGAGRAVATPRPISRAWKRQDVGANRLSAQGSQRPARYRGHGNPLLQVPRDEDLLVATPRPISRAWKRRGLCPRGSDAAVATPRPISRAWKPELDPVDLQALQVATPRPTSRAWKHEVPRATRDELNCRNVPPDVEGTEANGQLPGRGGEERSGRTTTPRWNRWHGRHGL